MEAFKEKLNEIRRIIEEDKYRRRVLLLCQQNEPRSFDDYSSSGSFGKLEKFESSTYSEVLKAVDLANNNKPVVMKIMRALSRGVMKKLPSVGTRGCQAYNDILNELVVTQALSKLHEGVILNNRPRSLYKTHFFCYIHEIKVVSGNLERAMRKSQSNSDLRQYQQQQQQQQQQYAQEQEELDRQRKLLATSSENEPSSGSKPSSSQTTETKASLTTPARTSDNKSFGKNNTTSDKSTGNNNVNKESDSDLEAMLRPEDAADPDTSELNRKVDPREADYKKLSEDDRMLMESLPYEYVVTVMRHDGQPLWWWITKKKLNAEQLSSVLVQVIVGLAIAEKVYLYEHRDLHVSNILIKKTSKKMIPFILEGNSFNVVSNGIKATIIDATFSRMTYKGKVYFRELTSTLRAYGSKKTPNKMSLQNRSYRQMVQLTDNNWDEFTPRTNLVWLTYLCETLMKSDILKSNQKLLLEVRKIRDYTLKSDNTLDLLSYFPFEKANKQSTLASASTDRKSSPSSGSQNSLIGGRGASYKIITLKKTDTPKNEEKLVAETSRIEEHENMNKIKKTRSGDGSPDNAFPESGSGGSSGPFKALMTSNLPLSLSDLNSSTGKQAPPRPQPATRDARPAATVTTDAVKATQVNVIQQTQQPSTASTAETNYGSANSFSSNDVNNPKK